MTRPCTCAPCLSRRLPYRDAVEPSPRSIGEGLFGARSPGSRSRYRECLAADLFYGRAAGRDPDNTSRAHPEYKCAPMPRPDFVQAAEADRVIEAVRVLVGDERILRKKLASVSDACAELTSATLAEYYAAKDDDLKQAFQRARWALEKMLRA